MNPTDDNEPIGALGRIEQLALQIGLIRRDDCPVLRGMPHHHRMPT